ncbi:hypothetical protein HELRODRAFT_173383 [Helobdella robusta]|uniref:Uncharacterized protein n=1 Tax=Helobdella robusta TaxID=6412 RepID=T1F6R2_HELRO|nr:hypothetical protein HELRODRAFT_173383 [Helobdella robusta]ESO03685.1 hypothetical protein HELRODRAFT_173383 [Helobdella robusta]
MLLEDKFYSVIFVLVGFSFSEVGSIACYRCHRCDEPTNLMMCPLRYQRSERKLVKDRFCISDSIPNTCLFVDNPLEYPITITCVCPTDACNTDLLYSYYVATKEAIVQIGEPKSYKNQSVLIDEIKNIKKVKSKSTKKLHHSRVNFTVRVKKIRLNGTSATTKVSETTLRSMKRRRKTTKSGLGVEKNVG